VYNREMSRRAEAALGTRPGVDDLVSRFREFPCGAAVKANDQLEPALASSCGAIFVLRANGLELGPVVHRIHLARKLAVVHLDLVDGLAADLTGVRWLVRCGADAIISSHGQAVRAIRAEGVVAIQRLLCVNLVGVELGLQAAARSEPDIVELLPGAILPEVADLVMSRLTVPLLAGGFIHDADAARGVLEAGALAVTTSQPALWGPWS